MRIVILIKGHEYPERVAPRVLHSFSLVLKIICLVVNVHRLDVQHSSLRYMHV